MQGAFPIRIAVTGATGLLGRHVVRHLIELGHNCRCWLRDESRIGDLEGQVWLEWVPGEIGNGADARNLVKGCDALVHCAVQGAMGARSESTADPTGDAIKNVVGSLALFEAARSVGMKRIVHISSCGVYGEICNDRFLDEAHPTWPTNLYGAGKAALEQFIHAYGLGEGVEMAALRPCAIYGPASPLSESRWYTLLKAVVEGKPVSVGGGTKVVHADDVAQAVDCLLFQAPAEKMAGRAFNCVDRYVCEFEVASLAKEIAGSDSVIEGEEATPKHTVVTDRLTSLGVTFGGRPLLRQTLSLLIDRIRAGE
ncbi:MAG: NAD-dependent epimerase/dehydratase family protein [Planctomycetota bacterium]